MTHFDADPAATPRQAAADTPTTVETVTATEGSGGAAAWPLVAARAVLRGISQVFLQRNAASGALIVLGLATFSWRLAALALLGSVVQTGAAAALGQGAAAVDGLMGYNGALVGAAASMDVASGGHAALATILGALACLPVQALLARALAVHPLARFGLPVLTAPFCIVAGVLLVLLRPLAPVAGALTTSTDPGPEAGLGVLNAAAEVFLADGALAGVVILIALFVASWRVGLWSLIGAAGAVAAGLAEHADPDSVSGGLLGYSAVLVAIAIGATFRDDRPVWWRLGLTVVGVGASIALRALMLHTDVPVYTWPFVLVTWALLAGTARTV